MSRKCSIFAVRLVLFFTKHEPFFIISYDFMRFSVHFFFRAFAAILVLGVLASACVQRSTVIPRNADEYYEQAFEAFTTEDLARAQKFFDVIKLQYPASKYADDAQYYLAEINVKKNENILAAYN